MPPLHVMIGRMLGWFHTLLVLFYLLLPIVSFLLAMRHVYRRPRSLEPVGTLITGVIGAIVAITGTLVYARQVSGKITLSQVFLTTYLVISLLLLLKLADRGLSVLTRSLVWRRDAEGAYHRRRFTPGLAFALRVGALFVVALPLVLGSLLVYRPRVQYPQTPSSAGFVYEQVMIPTEDGLLLRAWWIPSQSPVDNRWEPSSRTVIVCHGFGASAEGALPLAEQLVPFGYNVLMFDFRAHGFSDGQLCTFGALERLDVLAVVRWVHVAHPEESIELYGAGVGLGAAALINAAADKSVAGQAIQSLALYSPYASLRGLVDEVIGQDLPAPVRWMALQVALPIGSLTAGASLSGHAPDRQITSMWPRPVLIIHGLRDSIIPFSQGEDLFDAAAQPRQRLWLLRDNHVQTLRSPEAGLRMRLFFDTARPVPII